MSKIFLRAVLAIMVGVAPVASACTINSVTIAGNQLTITGTGFAGTPLAAIFNTKSIPIVSSSATKIVATLNPVPAPGSYRLVVNSGTASTFSYVSISSAPTIVAQVALTDVSSDIGTTTLYTPKADGDYQLVVYEVASAQNGNSELFTTISWANDLQSENMQCGPGGTSSPWTNSVTAIHAEGGDPIQFSARYAGGTSDLTYNIYLTVIKE
ncbi:MAG: IPT/TIG domain-containing protein [Terriglobales bacterium]